MLRRALDQVPGAELPMWAEKEGFKPALRGGVLLMEDDEGTVKLVHVPVILRVWVIQRAHYGPYTGHFEPTGAYGAYRQSGRYACEIPNF